MNDYFFSIVIVLFAIRTLNMPEKVRTTIDVILIVIAIVSLVICVHDLIIFIKFIFSQI